MVGIIGVMLLGLLLSAVVPIILWHRLDSIRFEKIFFLIWTPGALMVIVASILLLATLIKRI